MALTLPSELVYPLELMGFDWPELDEDEIRRAAVIVRQFRDDLHDSVSAIDSMIEGDLVASMQTSAGRSYAAAWTENRQGNMTNLVEILGPSADGIEIFADAVIAMKLKMIAELVITAAQIAAAIASAFVTFGAGAAVQVAIIAARKKLLEVAMNYILDQLLGQIIEMVIGPLTELAMATIAAMLESDVAQGVVSEGSEYVADLAALEAISADMETNSSAQESLGQDFVTQILSLQISTAG